MQTHKIHNHFNTIYTNKETEFTYQALITDNTSRHLIFQSAVKSLLRTTTRKFSNLTDSTLYQILLSSKKRQKNTLSLTLTFRHIFTEINSRHKNEEPLSLQ